MGMRTGAAETAMPTIKLGTLEVSRLILGSNPFFGFAHQTKERAQEMKEYYTDERIGAVLDEAAGQGITAVAAPPYERWIRLFNGYLERGGKLRIWIAQPDGPAERLSADIEAAIKGGAKAIFVQGGRVDEQMKKGTLDLVRRWVEQIKASGLPTGMASHRTDAHLEAERQGFPTDFYFQCICDPGEKYAAEGRAKFLDAVRQIDKPVVAYKILGAGRIPARHGFEFALSRLRRKDGVCVGVYPKDNPEALREDAELVRMLTG